LNEDHTERHRAFLLETYRPIIDPARPLALLDFQDTMNCGDHAIWLGEKRLLHILGAEVAYQCSVETYDAAALKAAVGDGQILLSGGGSFGDLYSHYHDFRLKVLADFPDNEVILFPQTVMFLSDEALKSTADAFARHGKVTVSARDALSFHILEQALGDTARLVRAPDMALMLGPLARRGAPRFDVVWISRTDHEGRKGPTPAVASGLKPVRSEIPAGVLPDGTRVRAGAGIAGSRLLVTDWYRTMPPKGALASYKRMPFDARSRWWLDVGMGFLSAGRVAITDRLHGHILCMLAGIPHVLINNSYGKNISYFETWSRPTPLCRLAIGPGRAWAMAEQMLAERREPASRESIGSVEPV
jgi:pyruvyl transferase EpsO